MGYGFNHPMKTWQWEKEDLVMKKIRDLIERIFERKDLLKYLIISRLKLTYANKVLGYFWSLIDPLAMALVYVILVGGIFKRGGPQFPVLVFSSILAWQWFTFSLSNSVTSLSSKSRIIITIKFPLAVLPLSVVLTYLLRYLLGLLSLIPLLFIYNADISFNILWFPFLVAVQLVFTVGLCLAASILGVYFKDMQNIVQFGLRLWFYLSPVLYTVQDAVPEKFHMLLYLINPFAALFTSYKSIFIWGRAPVQYIWVAALVSTACFFMGLIIFSTYEHRVVKDI
jgi:ABC-type polysaccharide/polyol phosphate export permease